MFLWHFPSSRLDRTLSCTLPSEARTFLSSEKERPSGVLRDAHHSIENGPVQSAGPFVHGGGKETRTPDPYAASVMLYQLSYAPKRPP